MTNKIALHFLRGYGNYNGGDIAGFDPDHAEALIKQGFAKKAAAQPPAGPLTTLTIAQPEMKAMLEQAVAELRAEIEADISAREVELEAQKESLEQAFAAYEAKAETLSQREAAASIRLEDLAQREADLAARIAAMRTDVTVTVDANGEVQAIVGAVASEIAEEAAKPAKATGLPKQGK